MACTFETAGLTSGVHWTLPYNSSPTHLWQWIRSGLAFGSGATAGGLLPSDADITALR